MDRFYRAVPAPPVADRVRQISDAVFSSPPAAHVLLAGDGGPRGLASFAVLWPAVEGCACSRVCT
jgi:hypothetical protein